MALKSERGTVLVQVAVSLLALLALSSFVIDHGVMMTARAQSQNAADAGALAGAWSLVMLQGDDQAREVAGAVAMRHRIFADDTEAGNVTVTVPLPCPPPYNTPSGCIKVDITKQDLPTFFAKLVNINTQGVKATATAMAGQGNSVECIKPWVVADKWVDNSGTGLDPTGWDQMDVFNPGVDTYTAPGFKASGIANDYGTQLVLKAGQTGEYSSGWTMEIEFGVPGSNAYLDALQGCPDFVPTVGIYDGANPKCTSRGDTPEPEAGCLDVKPGMSQGPTEKGVQAIVAKDSGASFDEGTNDVVGGCMGADPPTCKFSPRVVPIAMFNTAAYVAMDQEGACAGGNCVAQVVNIIGFFVEGMCDVVHPVEATRPAYCGTNAEAKKAVVGRLINYPGQAAGVAGAPGPATFVKTTMLIR
jgi:Flp pilus assembly protein TadG